ncbi:hypothetical protein GCM10010468_29450 [Actinocorallia longicatena]|uniref:Lipoprotein n=1 Tax=Actinocorallia longicatena TaxID=111803 RepID=A0ABP6QE73_9ACTN
MREETREGVVAGAVIVVIGFSLSVCSRFRVVRVAADPTGTGGTAPASASSPM